jgi:hypothetical protein
METNDKDDQLTKSLKLGFKEQLDFYLKKYKFTVANGELVATCTLDPRHKNLRFLEGDKAKRDAYYRFSSALVKKMEDKSGDNSVQNATVTEHENEEDSEKECAQVFLNEDETAQSSPGSSALNEFKEFRKLPTYRLTEFFTKFGDI